MQSSVCSASHEAADGARVSSQTKYTRTRVRIRLFGTIDFRNLMRHTTFRFALAPTAEQSRMFARYSGASRFAYNQSLQLVTDAIAARNVDPSVTVPWSSFDLINAFNRWKNSESAGRVFVVAPDGAATKLVTGLSWRKQISAQVFEEAAVDLSRGLARHAQRSGRRVGFPRRKRKGRGRDSFRLRNKDASGRGGIRVGEGHPRSVTLPKLGMVRVHDDTRRLRRMLRPVTHLDACTGEVVVGSPARVLSATVTRRAVRWYVHLNVEAADLHRGRRHRHRSEGDTRRFVGIDRGLAAFAVVADSTGAEICRFTAPRPLTRRHGRLRQRSRAFSRTRRGSRNRAKALRSLAREHQRIANIRRSFLHEVSSHLAKTHSGLAVEDLPVANLIRNRRLARAITDAAWAEFARQLRYKTAWLGGDLVVCDRWFPSTKTCSACGSVAEQVALRTRAFHCGACGVALDRDCNAATNLAAWAERTTIEAAQVPVRQAGGWVTHAPGGEGAGHCFSGGETVLCERGTNAPAPAGVKDTREGWRLTTYKRPVDAL
jgi:putative transposase